MTKRQAIPGPRRPVVRYHGGKWRLAPKIIRVFPPHARYVEAFGGGAGVLLRKPVLDCEVYNDLNHEIVNVFRVLRDPVLAERLRIVTTLTPYARAEHELSYIETDDPVEQARRTVFRAYSSYSGASRRQTGMRPTLGHRGNRPELDWRGWPANVPDFTRRLSAVQIECCDALGLIDKYDRTDTLIYCDPPYPFSTRTMVRTESHFHYGVNEMTDDDHRRLSVRLARCWSPVAISGYRCPLYDDLYARWTRHDFRAVANGGAERVECVWVKPAGIRLAPSRDALVQHSLLDVE